MQFEGEIGWLKCLGYAEVLLQAGVAIPSEVLKAEMFSEESISCNRMHRLFWESCR